MPADAGRPPRDTDPGSTLLGLAAIGIWSTTVAFARSLSEAIGPVTAGAGMFLGGGALGCIVLLPRHGGLRQVARLPRPYLLGCGLLFVLYQSCLILAVGLAAGRREVLEVGLINYLWPGLTVLLSVPLLGKRAGPLLLPGVALAFVGVWLGAATPDASLLAGLIEHVRATPLPYGLALVAAISWALYSNLARRWAHSAQGEPVPVFLVASGLVALALRWILGETSTWSGATAAEFLYMAIGPSLLAYVFWDRAMRRGRIVLVAAFSYLTPLLSTIASSVYLEVTPPWTLWAACALVVAGAALSQRSVIEPPRDRRRAAPGHAPFAGPIEEIRAEWAADPAPGGTVTRAVEVEHPALGPRRVVLALGRIEQRPGEWYFEVSVVAGESTSRQWLATGPRDEVLAFLEAEGSAESVAAAVAAIDAADFHTGELPELG